MRKKENWKTHTRTVGATQEEKRNTNEEDGEENTAARVRPIFLLGRSTEHQPDRSLGSQKKESIR